MKHRVPHRGGLLLDLCDHSCSADKAVVDALFAVVEALMVEGVTTSEKDNTTSLDEAWTVVASLLLRWHERLVNTESG